ncbi:hypothetical protein Ais01nite_30060 [Asanoa ishikariensis]|uniref:Ribosomally synthesized peptide with SipW-like signal peptide n=1 Tax=Asanoa ishikariensis TaxID=137265 RepID=A0A1H3QJ26_9ACTN|nr:hypothetical protein [Asanoa ishikariensis]GIF64971.1 hypothetical protein Ais01nite_30060 [Asanoa ishikariensis]SDZ13416.1 hypothetical protein SAMN05421684_2916 [Asanoa ishikariensis]
MQKRSKRILAAALAVAGVIAASGIAYAAFYYAPQATAQGAAAKFGEITVTAEWSTTAPLLPGNAADVKLTIASPTNNNVQARISSITAVNIPYTDIEGPLAADKPDCATWLIERVLGNPGIVLPPNSVVVVTIDDAITLHGDATVKCQGMTFPTKWNVQLDATNDPANTSHGASITI